MSESAVGIVDCTDRGVAPTGGAVAAVSTANTAAEATATGNEADDELAGTADPLSSGYDADAVVAGVNPATCSADVGGDAVGTKSCDLLPPALAAVVVSVVAGNPLGRGPATVDGTPAVDERCPPLNRSAVSCCKSVCNPCNMAGGA